MKAAGSPSAHHSCLISAHFSNRNKKDHYRYSKLAYNRNKKAYKTSRLFDFGALLQQKQETPLPINTKGWRPPLRTNRLHGQKYLAHFSNEKRFTPSVRKSLSIRFRKPIKRIPLSIYWRTYPTKNHTRVVYKIHAFTSSREIHFNTVLQRASRHDYSNIHDASIFRSLRQP